MCPEAERDLTKQPRKRAANSAKERKNSLKEGSGVGLKKKKKGD